MHTDLVDRRLRIMGPEDYSESITLEGWPFLVIAREEELNAISVAGWGYVLEHEFVHMVAAANLARDGLNLAELMRKPDGTFTHEARFHEVCADFYPQDELGNHKPVAQFYGAMNRMPELLSILELIDSDLVVYQPRADHQVLSITSVGLVDAACVWDRNAMQTVKELYDEERGVGAFDLLFPMY